jgi:hypothetical protein
MVRGRVWGCNITWRPQVDWEEKNEALRTKKWRGEGKYALENPGGSM